MLPRSSGHTGSMQRFGPLRSIEGGVAVGDSGGKHLILGVERIAYRGAGDHTDEFAWTDVQAITLDLPSTRFRAPAILFGFLLIVTSLLSAQVIDDLPEDGTVTVLTHGTERRLAITRHHVGSYWNRSVQATQHLLDRLVSDPPSRELLGHPDHLIQAVIASTR